MRIMDVTRKCLRSLAISLTIVLAIIEVTQGFTIRNRRLQDMVAEESSLVEVRNDSSKLADVIATERNVAEAVVPMHVMVDVDTITTVSTETEKKELDGALFEKVADEQSFGVIPNVNSSEVIHSSGISSMAWFETTDKNEYQTDTNLVSKMSTEKDAQEKDEFDKILLAVQLKNVTEQTTPLPEQDTAKFLITTENTDYSTATVDTTEEKELRPETSSTETDFTVMSTTLTPIFKVAPEPKKYVTIERKRVPTNSEEEKITPTERIADSLNAHTTESRVSLEKAFDLAPDILSLQELNRLFDTTHEIQLQQNLMKNNASENDTELLQAITSTTMASTTEEITKTTSENNQVDQMVSVRAGYLDHSKMITPTVETLVNTSRDAYVELDSVAYEVDPPENARVNATSQSQLAEDAIKEELMKESLINDKEVYSIRYGVSPEVTVSTVETTMSDTTTSEPKVVDDLSVKPISPEKKNTNIYTVSPNYKPLKKIEVQPPKSFTRHPDDVSWRNESLSSLGIVFKANNATKAFTEVLKNKTEIVMNNLADQNKSIEKVELRDRLEKIAEKRKSKKKKTDQFGNTEYTDYEENNNSGDSQSSKETPVDSIPKEMPVESVSKATPENTTTKETPVAIVLKETPIIITSNETPVNTTSEEKPVDIARTEIPVNIVPLAVLTSTTTSAPLVSTVPKSTTTPKYTTKSLYTTPKYTTPKYTTNIASLVTNPYTFSVTGKPKKVFNIQDYYDVQDEDEYVTLPNVDIMKSTTRPRVQWPVTQKLLDNTRPTQLLPERKPTVQYFPPRAKPSPDVNVNEYDDEFKRKINIYYKDTPKTAPPYTAVQASARFPENKHYSTESNFRNQNVNYAPNENRNYPPTVQHVQYRPVDVKQNGQLTQSPKLPPESAYENPEGTRGFIIRHYKDLIDAALKDVDYDRNAYLFTEAPVTGVTATDIRKTTVKSDEYEYDVRKEVLERFVDNFNQNHEQFKVDFPVLFNTSIVHKHGQDAGKVLASSSAMFKRLYSDSTATKANGFLFNNKPYDPNCENITVELSPAYELHYYVPEQEEKEEQKVTIPYGYRV